MFCGAAATGFGGGGGGAGADIANAAIGLLISTTLERVPIAFSRIGST